MAYRYRCSVVCLSVSLLDTTMSCAKTAEPIEMPFGLRTQVDPRNHLLDEGFDPPRGRGNFRGCAAIANALQQRRRRKRTAVQTIHSVYIPTDIVWPQQYTREGLPQIHICIYAKKQFETNCANRRMLTTAMTSRA